MPLITESAGLCLQGLRAKQLLVGFSTAGTHYQLGAHLRKEGPALSWVLDGQGQTYTEKKITKYCSEFGVGDVVTATINNGTIQ